MPTDLLHGPYAFLLCQAQLSPAPVAGRPGPVARPFPGPLRHLASRLLVDIVTMKPDPSQLPGGDLLQKLMDGLQFWALALALVGLVIGAAAWALGSHGQNYQQSFVGRRAVLISGLAALLIGAGPGIVSFFYNAGSGVH
jgi:hypothetical protein